jgi:tetratricopeptide (TPR) repeat protein
VEISPLWAAPRLALAQLYLDSGDLNLALEQTDWVLKRQAKNEAALLMAGVARLKKKEVDKAMVVFKAAQAVNPKSAAAAANIAAVDVVQKKYSEALKIYDALLKADPNRTDVLYSAAQIHLLQGNPKAALELAEKYLPRTKNRAAVYQLMGQLKLRSKEFPRAIEYFEKAVDLDPSIASAYFSIGNAYAAQGKFDAAIEQYQKMISKKPKDVTALMVLGIIYDKKNQTQKANEYYQKALDINKNFAPAANNLAWNYAHHGGNIDVALGIAQRAREANPTDPGIADTLGWINYKKGSYLTAISLLKESNEKFKGANPEVLYHLGMSHLKNGDKAAARDVLAKALATDRPFMGRDEAKKTLDSLKS